jgi:hypothetical protein
MKRNEEDVYELRLTARRGIVASESRGNDIKRGSWKSGGRFG